MTGNMIFAKRIKQLREDRGDSQEDLAKLFGYKKQAVSHWENNGKVPRSKVLEKLAERYQTSSDYLLGFTDDPSLRKSNGNEKKYPRQFVELIEQEDFILNGELATPEDKERLIQVYYLMFQDAKEKNKKARAAAKARKEENKE